MGKYYKQPRKTAGRQRFGLSDRLSSFVKTLHKTCPDMSTRYYLSKVHAFIRKEKKEGRKIEAASDPYRYLRICKGCSKWNLLQPLIECYQCEDVYHENCKDNYPESDEYNWICGKCYKLCRQALRQQTNEKSNGFPPTRYFCKQCRREILYNRATCLYCNKDYHGIECWQTVRKGLVCLDCHPIISSKIYNRCCKLIKMRQIIIEDSSQNMEYSTAQQNKKTKCTSEFINFKPPPHMTENYRNTCISSLMYAIESKHMHYVEYLEFREQWNECLFLSVDILLEQMNKRDLKAFHEYKERPIGPYEVVPTSNLGYDVIAIKNIPRGTIICEYVGEVITKREALNMPSYNDMMELLTTNDADSSLLIWPQKKTNIARFINGVNNSKEEAVKNMNVQTVRLLADGTPRIILYARRDILKGERLNYDYNAGGKNLFPTDDFE